MPILARQTAGSELERSRIPGLAEPRTARMACRHGVMVSGHVLSHFTRWMHGPNMHDEHRRHGHSAQATMITSSAAAMDFFSIRLIIADREPS